jgi:hypothetical protein
MLLEKQQLSLFGTNGLKKQMQLDCLLKSYLI